MTIAPSKAKQAGLCWPVILVLSTVHIGAAFAPFTFSWTGLITGVVLYLLTGCFGISLCYHRFLSHKSFETHPWMRAFMMFCAALCLEGGPIWWANTHRLHHRYSDEPQDPHSPRGNGFWWAHLLWMLYKDANSAVEEDRRSNVCLTPDLLADPIAQFFERYFVVITVGFLAALFGVGYLLGGLKLGASLLVWGGFLRMVVLWHMTWCVNSVTHLVGYRRYETKDDSRNIWWVALLTFGEGWHNNHHAHPATARSGHAWWEFDLSYCVIRVLTVLGVFWKVHPLPVTQSVPLAQSQKKLARAAR